MHRMATDTLRIVTLNIENGGIDGTDTTRWDTALELLRELEVDIALVQEMRNHSNRIADVDSKLGMACVMAPNGKGHHRTAIYLRKSTFASISNPWPHEWPWKLAPTDVTVTLPGRPNTEVTIVSWHFAFAEPKRRELEAEELQSLMDKMKNGKFLIMGGDCNAFPRPGDEVVSPIDWETVVDKGFRRQRAPRNTDGVREQDTFLDDMMLDWDMPDVARYAARHLGQTDALAATAGHAPGATLQGGEYRGDRIYLDPRLLPAITNVEVVRTDKFSDHHAVVTTVDTARIDAAFNHTTPFVA